MIKVYFDLETQETDDAAIIRSIQESVKPPANYKKQDTIDAWFKEQGAAARVEAVSRTALNGTYGRLASIGFAAEDDDPIVLTNDGDERGLMQFFQSRLKESVTKFLPTGAHWASSILWVGHNIKSFDARFIRQRAIICGVPGEYPPLYRYSEHVFDTMTEWAGDRDYIKQKTLEMVFGIPRIDPLSGGADVGEAIKEGRWDDVVAHNTADVVNLREIYKRMTSI